MNYLLILLAARFCIVCCAQIAVQKFRAVNTLNIDYAGAIRSATLAAAALLAALAVHNHLPQWAW